MSTNFKIYIYFSLWTWFLISIGCSDDHQPIDKLMNNDSTGVVDTSKIRLKGAQGITLYDINNRKNASDVRLFYTLSDPISLISSIRFFLVKENLADTFSISKAKDNPYFAVLPQQSSVKTNLGSALLDADGDSLKIGEGYVGFVWAQGKDTNTVGALTRSSQKIVLSDDPLQDLYVSSRGTNAVVLFDGVTGEYIRDFVGNGYGGLNLTQDVLFGFDGNLLVSGRGNTAIKKYNTQNGAFISDFTSGYLLDEPTKISFSPQGTLYVSQWGQTKKGVAEFNGTSGVFIREVISALNLGMDHVWDSTGNLYVASYGSLDVRKYDSAGSFLTTIISSGLQGPVNLWFSSDYSILHVVDWTSGSVRKYSPDGTFLSTWISGLNTVEGFAFDDNDHLYLCEWNSNRIRQYQASTGTFIKIFSSGNVVQPNSIAFGPNVDP